MKIVQILPKLDIGGVERGVIDLVKYFKNTNIENIVISSGGRLVSELNKLGIKHYRLPVHRKSLTSLFLIPKLKKIFIREKVDIIHARSRVPAWISFFASRRTNSQFITTCHGVYKNRFFSEVMGWGKFVICPSKVVARHMHDNFGIREDKIIVIERWVDLNRFKFMPYELKKNTNTIVSVGRISPSKGYEYLIEGFRKVVRFNPYLKLKIVGEADRSKVSYLNYLKTLVRRFALDYNVQFLGFRDDVENVLKEAKILVAPSVIEESFGRVIIEAFASGVAVIATRVGGFSQIIEDGKDGILVEPKNPQAIADAINKLLSDPVITNLFTINARNKVEKLYSIERRLKETEEVYKKVLATKRILIIKISSLGDLILSFPFFKEIRKNFSNDKIYCLTLKKYASILYDCPYIDEIITVDEDYKKFKNILKISKQLRRLSFDYIIDLQNNKASHLLAFLSFPKASFGYSLRWGFFLTHKLRYTREDDPLKSQERILELLGIKFEQKKLIFWDIPAVSKLLSGENFIGICVSASKRWSSKNWPAKHIITLINLINKNFPKYKIVLFGDEDAKEIAKEIENNITIKIYNFCGKTSLRDLPSLIKKIEVFISPDTATLHLSLALGIPTIGLFGPTSPFKHTVKDNNLYIFYKKLFCSFCYKPRCRLKEKNLCMLKITPQEVLAVIKNILRDY